MITLLIITILSLIRSIFWLNLVKKGPTSRSNYLSWIFCLNYKVNNEGTVSNGGIPDDVKELSEKTEVNLKLDDDDNNVTPEQSRINTDQSALNQKKPSKAQKRRVSLLKFLSFLWIWFDQFDQHYDVSLNCFNLHSIAVYIAAWVAPLDARFYGVLFIV